MPRARFWTPYRKAVVAFVFPYSLSACLFFWLIMLLGGSISFHLWILLLIVVPLGLFDIFAMPPSSRGGLGACPRCRKSPLVTYVASGPSGWRWIGSRLWPEKICSECDYDLTEEADAY
jgi:hypothetical protein